MIVKIFCQCYFAIFKCMFGYSEETPKSRRLVIKLFLYNCTSDYSIDILLTGTSQISSAKNVQLKTPQRHTTTTKPAFFSLQKKSANALQLNCVKITAFCFSTYKRQITHDYIVTKTIFFIFEQENQQLRRCSSQT